MDSYPSKSNRKLAIFFFSKNLANFAYFLLVQSFQIAKETFCQTVF